MTNVQRVDFAMYSVLGRDGLIDASYSGNNVALVGNKSIIELLWLSSAVKDFHNNFSKIRLWRYLYASN